MKSGGEESALGPNQTFDRGLRVARNPFLKERRHLRAHGRRDVPYFNITVSSGHGEEVAGLAQGQALNSRWRRNEETDVMDLPSRHVSSCAETEILSLKVLKEVTGPCCFVIEWILKVSLRSCSAQLQGERQL